MRSYLEQHGISSTLRNEHTSSLIGELPFMDNNPEIWVDAASADEAITLVRQSQNSGSHDGLDWACHECNETNPGNFEICWQCGAKIKP